MSKIAYSRIKRNRKILSLRIKKEVLFLVFSFIFLVTNEQIRSYATLEKVYLSGFITKIK